MLRVGSALTDIATTSAKPSSEPETLWRWGVDTGSRRVAIAAKQGRHHHTRQVHEFEPSGELATDLSHLHSLVGHLIADLASKAPPLLICIERPSGRFPNPSLMAAWGVTIEALQSGLHDYFGRPVMIIPVAPSQWKKRCLDNGNAPPSAYLAAAKLRFGKALVENNPDLAAALWLSDYAHRLKVT